MVYVRYLGHSAFHIQIQGVEIYLDPWLDSTMESMPRLVSPAIKSNEIKKADLILVSHEHFDHSDPVSVKTIVQRTAAKVYAPQETLNLFDLSSRSLNPVEVGAEFNALGLNISVVPAKHSNCLNPVGFVIKGEGKSIYFAGDTYDFYDMVNISVDCALLPIGGTYTMDILSSIKALKELRTKYVIPMHYNTFEKIKTNVNDFESRVKSSTKVDPILLNCGQSVQF